MNKSPNTGTTGKWFLILFSAMLVTAFFIPWVSWDGKKINGADMAIGNFFKLSEAGYGLANPFPQFNFAMLIIWLIPIAAILTLLFAISNKKTLVTALLAGILALSIATLYYRFSGVLGDLGANYNFEIGFYITLLAAAGIILASTGSWLVKIIALVAGPAITFFGFMATESYLKNEKFDDTANSSSAYTVNALDLVREFQTNDSVANAKYREKIITVNGNISALELPNDSTVNIKFTDTTGSYAIFPLTGQAATTAKTLKEGEKVSVKGECSGGVLSEILGIHSITFKRCTLNKE